MTSKKKLSLVVRVTGKRPSAKVGKKRYTLYLHLPLKLADEMGLKFGDYVVMEFDGEKLVIRKLNI